MNPIPRGFDWPLSEGRWGNPYSGFPQTPLPKPTKPLMPLPLSPGPNMRSPRMRLVLIGALLVLTPALAGCNFKDWYNQRGDVRVFLQPVGPNNSSISDFTSLKIAIFGVTLKQLLVVDSQAFSYGASPLILDMVTLGARNERLEVAQAKESIRPLETITITVDVIEARDAQRREIPVCREGTTSDAQTCFFLDAKGFIRFERNIAINRGGTVEITMPLQVKVATVGTKTEYFLVSDVSQAVIENK